MDLTDTTTHPTTPFLDELLTWFATIDETLAQMQAYAVVTKGRSADPNDSRLILRDLLAGTFAHREPQPDAELLAQATALVGWATTTLTDELLYVPPQDRATRRAIDRETRRRRRLR